MKLPNWFKIIWWLALSAAVTVFLGARYRDLVAGRAVPADIVVFLVWIALLLVPVFQEVEFFGIKFKQQIDKVKEELKAEIHSVRAELRNTVDVRNIYSPQITMPAPPPDSQLPGLEERVKAAVGEALSAHGIRLPTAKPADLTVSDDIAFLFATRYGLEQELRRLARERQLDAGMRRVGGLQLSRALAQTGVIEPALDHVIREVYAVSFTGVHAEDVTEAQVAFVRDVGPQLVATLRALRGVV